MNNLICIKNLRKKYESTGYIIDDFSYVFKKNGFYVLFGESGSGKTTLLNIICGLISFNDGSCYFNNKKYNKCIDKDYIGNYIAYLTQENYFIDYLTVNDNIRLCSNEEFEISELLKKFSLTEKINVYPSQLSGGEKQKLSLIQALLKKKRIIILDEPTSALDKQNKKEIFKLLNDLKKDVLIICSSHDVEILNYCDEIIDFKNLDRYHNNKLSENTISIHENTNNYTVENLYEYVRKQNKYNNTTKKINILLRLVFLISILITFFCYNVERKLLKTIQNKYHINYLTMYCPLDNNQQLCNALFKTERISEVSFVYSLNIPLETVSEEGFVGNLNFSTDLITLSSNSENFPFINNLLYGNYFENNNEVILGYDMALKYDFENMKSLIGDSINIKTPDGVNEFKVVGIFKQFDNIEKQYFKSGQVQIENIDSKYFISGKFTERYIDDDIIGYNEQNVNKMVYYVYFNNFKGLLKTYKEFLNNKVNENNIYISSFPNQYLDIMEQFNNLSVFLYPIVIISIIIAIAFYYQVLKLNINYNCHIFCVYEYYGYNLKKIKKAMMKNYICNVIYNFGIAFIFSIIISLIINILNNKFTFFKYEIFTINLFSVSMLFLFLIIISIIMSVSLFKNIKSKGWYGLIKNSGDLI